MLALQFSDSIPRYVVSKASGRGYKEVYWSSLACLQAREVPPPALPTPEWVRVRTRYGGICGSDLATILLHASPSNSPFLSFPFTLGHENVGRVSELGSAVEGFAVGDRVVVNPLLGCVARGFSELCPMCARGEPNLCQRFRAGDIAPGMLIGFCRDTGGSWSREFVAHRSQLIRLPDSVSDENGLMVEPFAGALHPVLRNRPADDETVLIHGAGVMGLCVLAALRAIGSRARVIVTARHPFQQAMAEKLGADEVVRPKRGADLYRQIVTLTGGEVLKPVIGRHVVLGGADTVFECVGSDATIDDALRLTRAGGTMVLVGVAGVPKSVDWTPIWYDEVKVHGTFCYAQEQFDGECLSTMELAVRLMTEGKLDLSSFVTHRFRLEDYREALATVTSKSRSGVIRAVFTFDQS